MEPEAKIKVMTVFGTRPEAIKMAPVILELTKYPDKIIPIVAVTAQHREMLDQVLRLFRIRPAYDLNIMAEGHVEAGLRTRNKYSPFPEEMNRRLTGAIADLHFAPTATSEKNLLAENVPADNVFVTGNTVIDALRHTVRADFSFAGILSDIDFKNHRIVLVTTHRRENLGEPMRHVYKALRRLTEEFPDIEVVFPVHRNPKVREVVRQELGDVTRVHLIDPLDYEPFANLMARSALILTDSGGVQEEGPALGKPVLVLRDNTERPEAVAAGTVKLIGTEEGRVYEETSRLLSDGAAYRAMAEACNPYGDGQAARRIVEAVLHRYGLAAHGPERFEAEKSEG